MKKLLMILTLFFLYGLGYAQPTVIYFTSAGLHKTTLTPTTLTTGTLLDATNMSYQTMEYANGIVYAVSRPAWPAISAFGTIDKNTGAFTVIKEDIGYNVSGLAWNPLDNTMYAVYQTASATSRGFGKINLTTGDFEEIGATWAVNAMQLQASIVIDNDGICYFLDYGQNASMRFGTLNLTTGAQTAILTNINAQNRLTDMSIDRETDVMYVSTPGANTVNSLSTITKAGARTTYGSPTTSQRWQAFAIFTEEPSSTTDYTVNIATPTNGSITVMNGSTPVTDGTQLPEGTTLTLTATPATGYEFDQWWDGNTTTPRTITLTKDTTISATFAVISNFTVTITPPTNGSITVMDGTTPVNNGDVVEDGTTLTLTATPAEGYKFSQWWDGNTTTPRTITVTKDTIISATFTAIPNFTAIIPTVSNGTITVMNGSTPVTSGTQLPEGTILSLTATPDLDYMLDRWWDGNTNATRNITLTGDTTISATFRKISTVMFFDGTNLRKSTWSSSTLTTAASEVLAAPPTGGTYKAIEFANGVVYAVHRVNNFPATTSFGTLDKTTGTYTIINTDVGYDVTGLAWNPQDNTMYAAYGTGNNRGFAKIDLKTGALTEIGPQIFGMNIWWTIAIDNEGDCYAMEYGGTSRIGKINLETGAFTQIVGNLSSASMFTDMSIDRETNQIYANTPGGNTVFTIASINKTTGARTTFGTVTTRWHAFAVFVDEPAPMHTVTITSETHGNITVMNGATVVNTGDQLPGGTVLTLTATPNANAEFVAWWDGDTATTRTIALIANTTISATFVARYHTVTFATPSNGTLSVTYRNEVNEVVSVESGEEVEEGTILTITATPNDHYYLELLEVNNSPFTSSQTYTVMNDVTINVAFAINQYQVTYATPAGGTLTVTRDAGIDVPSGTSVDHGTVLTITATPNPNHTLATLTVNSATFTNGSTHTVNGPVTITASFQITYTLTITQPDGENVIEVWDVDEMVQFGSGSSIEAGTELKLMAFPADDYEFVEWWDGNTEQFRTITLDSDMTISATFQEVIIYYTVFIEAPEIGGTITVMKNEKGVVSDGDELEAGTELILLATAHQGYRFVEWWHGGTDAEHTHVLNDHVTISAIFEDDEVSIAITIGRELFAVYPNPTADVLHIQTEQVIKQIFVLDLTGKVMMTLQGDQKTINLQSLPIGHYIVRIHTDTTIVPVKIVKQ